MGAIDTPEAKTWLVASLRAGNATHPRGSITVKELYDVKMVRGGFRRQRLRPGLLHVPVSGVKRTLRGHGR